MATVVITVADGFDEAEFSVSRNRLHSAGHEVVLVGPREGQEVASDGARLTAIVDAAPGDAAATDYDALLIPGGRAPDRLSRDAAMVGFVKAFAATGRPIAAICSGLKLLVEADAVAGRALTSWPAGRAELQHAGAAWIDATVVLDGNLVTSRRPEDLGHFCDALLAKLGDAPTG